jgi:hypothetical protein
MHYTKMVFVGAWGTAMVCGLGAVCVGLKPHPMRFVFWGQGLLPIARFFA